MKEPVAHGSFQQFPSSCQANFEQRFETSQKLKCDLDVFPSAGVKQFNRLPEKNTHAIRRDGKSLSRVSGSWESSYCSLLCRLVLTIFFMFSSDENYNEMYFYIRAYLEHFWLLQGNFQMLPHKIYMKLWLFY